MAHLILELAGAVCVIAVVVDVVRVRRRGPAVGPAGPPARLTIDWSKRA